MARVVMRILLVVVVLLLAVFGYHFYNILTAEDRVTGLCTQITHGMPLAELQVFAEEHGLLPPTDEPGVHPMVEQKSYGRWGCWVTVKDGVIENAEYRYLD